LSTERSRGNPTARTTVKTPTVLRRVVELAPSTDRDNLPEVLQEAITRVESTQHNSNSAIGVLLFNRRDGIYASRNNGYSDIDLFNNVSDAIKKIDDNVFEATVSHFNIHGVNSKPEGFRYVSAVLDDESRMKLQYQANIIRNSVGLEPRDRIVPFHFSVFRTRDQLEAENVLEECSSISAELSVALSGPLIKTVVQTPGSVDFL
jgi:hypothetical protein